MEVGKGSQKGTFAGKRGNGEVAPKAALCHCEQLTVVSRRCRIPHRDVVTLSDDVLNCRPEVGKRRSYALYKLGKSFRTIFLARNLFVTPVHEIR